MTILSLKNHSESGSEKYYDIFSIITESGWIKIISESALKILMYFFYQKDKGQSLVGNYSSISNYTNLSRSSISNGLSELEAFGFINCSRTMRNKTKIYDICLSISLLNEIWINFFKNKLYKEVAISFLLSKDVSENNLEKIKNIVKDKNDSFTQNTLGRLLFLHTKKKLFSIRELLEEERILMDDLFTPEELGLTESNWQDILTEEEKSNKYLMDIFEHYAIHVNYPTRDDIDLIEKAYKICYPYQIKNAITVTKNHPIFGPRFTKFSYVYEMLIKGKFQTRLKNNLKDSYKSDKNIKKKKNNQTDIGFKKSSLSREEIIKAMEDAANSGEEFDFSKLEK